MPRMLAALTLFHNAIKADAVGVTEKIVRRVYLRVHGEARKPPIVSTEPSEPFEPAGW